MKDEIIYYVDELIFTYDFLYNKKNYNSCSEAEENGELYVATLFTNTPTILRINNVLPLKLKNLTGKRKIINRKFDLKDKPKFHKSNGFYFYIKKR